MFGGVRTVSKHLTGMGILDADPKPRQKDTIQAIY